MLLRSSRGYGLSPPTSDPARYETERAKTSTTSHANHRYSVGLIPRKSKIYGAYVQTTKSHESDSVFNNSRSLVNMWVVKFTFNVPYWTGTVGWSAR